MMVPEFCRPASWSTRSAVPAALAVVSAFGWLSPALADVEVSGGWSRETVQGTTVGVGYLTLKNTGTSQAELMKITTPIADSVALHQSSVDAQGIAHMWPVASLELKPGEVVRLTPNGKHLMLMGLSKPLHAGDTIPLTMQFDRDSPPVTILLTVLPLLSTTPPSNTHETH